MCKPVEAVMTLELYALRTTSESMPVFMKSIPVAVHYPKRLHESFLDAWEEFAPEVMRDLVEYLPEAETDSGIQESFFE